jgi:hypothetical protein
MTMSDNNRPSNDPRLTDRSVTGRSHDTDVMSTPPSDEYQWDEPPPAWRNERTYVSEPNYVNNVVRPLRDRVRWGAIWAGLLVAVGSYLVIQLALVATGAIDLADPNEADAWWSAAAALVAFFVGGLTTGASTMWDNATDGVLHGVVLWAVGVVALLVLSVASSGLTLGALDATGVFDSVSTDIDDAIGDIDAQDAGDGAREAASWVLLGLGAGIVAAVVGGSVGATLWPRRDVDERR